MSFSLALLSLLVTALPFTASAVEAKKSPSTDDGKVMSCTVDFRTKGGLTWFQTQKQAWQLPEKKGTVELKSIGDVEILLSKDAGNKTATFTLSIKQGKHNLGDLKVDHRSFEYSTPVDVKMEDGNEGWMADQVRVVCDTTVLAK